MRPDSNSKPANAARDALGFGHVAQIAFGFLSSDFGFRVVESEDPIR